jgi:LuxR family transcriptional regulator, maltose regulon positive regulatory protein
MTAKTVISAKITRPTISGAVQRERLFSLLDGTVKKPVVWVSAPAGSGKTTLVSSWLDSRKLPCIWYYCDEGDSDPATFFYYMGLAAKKTAPRRRNPLPLLTPEYLAGITTFTRSFFEMLYDRLVPGRASREIPPGPPFAKGGEVRGVIVLDNYQDVPAESPFHEIMDKGFAVARDGIRIVVISREEPPPAYARLRASGRMNQLRSSDILFTLDESRELVNGLNPNLDDDYISVMHEKTAGWAAGIILMLEREMFNDTGSESPADHAYERVFDYFAGELFDRTDKGVRDFLLKTAFLPALSVPLAEKLTGVGTAESILSALNRHHYFTERLAGSGQEYQYHPLFRDFLLNRGKTAFPADELAVIRKDAALLLEQTGQLEDAARLYTDAGDRHGLARIVIRHGRELLMQGRNKTVKEWISAIPGAPGDDNPWLLYWTGMCSFPLDMPRTRHYLEKALESFKATDDTLGIYLSWAGIVDTYAFGLDEWKRLDDCICAFEELRKTRPSFPSRDIDLIASSRMLICLTLRKTDRPNLVHRWLQHVSALLQESPSFDIQMDTMFCMSLYYLWKGEYDKNAVLLERAEAEILHRKPSPFTVIRLKLMMGIHYWISAEYESALNTLSEGLEISAGSGVHVFDSLLWGFRAAAEMAPGSLELAEKSLGNQMASLLDTTKTLDTFFYHINSAWYALLKGNPSLAAEHLETISARTVRMGTPYYRALWHMGMAQTAFLQGRAKDAKAYVQTALRISLSMKSHVMEWYALLIDAWFLLREGEEEQGLQSLRRGLSLGRRHGYAHLEFYLPPVMRFLFAKALAEGIEPEYVKGLIKKLGLTPPNPLVSSPLLPLDKEKTGGIIYLEEWPYPIKIYTLGRFEILRDDTPLAFSGKEQKKPLDLLKALIAFGGVEVPEERLTDALWPDADGDLAHKSFETTLGRLRRLLGGDACIRYRARQLTINPLYCWVDSLALGFLFDTIQATSGDQTTLLGEKAVDLHRGPFLPSDFALSWALPCRETLKNRLLRVIRKAGRQYEEAGEWERAAEYYTKGIETDSLAEEFYRRLMVCHRNQGNNADAVTTYNRCCRLLRAELGIEPSTETMAVFSAIIQKPY